MFLFKQIKDWPAIKGILLQQASQLINSGRHHTVSQWIEALPSKYLATDAWLSYWYAVALKPVDPLLAEAQLEKCYQLFVINQDVKGIYSSWLTAVDSITVNWHDFSRLKIWMNRFDKICKHYPACPSNELKIQFYAAAINGLTFYNPKHHPRLKIIIRICERLFRFTPTKTVKLVLGTQLAQYYIFNYQLTKLHSIAPFLESALEDEAMPVMARILSAYLLVNQRLLMADPAKALEYTHVGLQLTELSGIHLFEGMLFANIAGIHINNGNPMNAEMVLQKAIKGENVHQRIPIAMNYAYTVWLAALTGKLQYALEQNQQALQLAKLIHFEIASVCLRSLEVQIRAELSQWKKAKQALSLLSATTKNTNNKHNLIQYHIADAWLAYLQHNQPHALTALKALLEILRTEQIFAFFGWRPNVLIPLCLQAIENGIEEEFAVCLLKCHQLLTRPPAHLEKWPWPVRIYSFDSFVIQVDGKPIEQSGKGQRKILELLEMLVLLGGRNVNGAQLSELLWPDTEGDLAKQSLEITLHRLRKFLGKEAVLMNAGMVSLNGNYCWLDLWTFEATVDELELALNDRQQAEIIKLTDRLLTLYRGPFLKNSDSGLAILKQSQLLNKLSHVLDLTINFHEKNEEYDRIHLLLTKVLELKPLTEANYRRLMSYYLRQGQPDQALQTYHQCHRILLKGFKIRLSNEIQELARQLKIMK